MDNSGTYVGLDIGTTSIKVVIAEYAKNQMNIIGYGNTRSAGLNRGVVVDIDQVVQAIKESIAPDIRGKRRRACESLVD